MKLNRVDEFGVIYEVTKKEFFTVKGRLKNPKRTCAFVTCDTLISNRALKGFCRAHLVTTKSKTGFKAPFLGLGYVQLGDKCSIKNCTNLTPSVTKLCGKHTKFKLNRSKPKAHFTPGGLPELERIVAFEKSIQDKRQPLL